MLRCIRTDPTEPTGPVRLPQHKALLSAGLNGEEEGNERWKRVPTHQPVSRVSSTPTIPCVLGIKLWDTGQVSSTCTLAPHATPLPFFYFVRGNFWSGRRGWCMWYALWHGQHQWLVDSTLNTKAKALFCTNTFDPVKK